jgi:cyclopropane-fatty-acyl-phospholipid synthase
MTTHIDSGWQTSDKSDVKISRQILELMFKNYPGGFLIKLWDDSVLKIGESAATFSLTLKHAKIVHDLILFRDPVRLAEAYFDGGVEIEGDFNTLMDLRYYLEKIKLPLLDKLNVLFNTLMLGGYMPRKNLIRGRLSSTPRQNDKDSIAFHYDVSNDFYKIWLDEKMVYSCAYFENQEQDLETAQRQKLDHICRKLRLHEGDSFLDIGCGWGALVCWAAKHYGVKAHGITLSQNQFDYACNEVKRQKLEGQVTIELRDYRDLPRTPTYDKISSIGMFEHVGLKNLPNYFSIVRNVLKPKGLFLNHGITSDEPGWQHGVGTKFINRHVFPDGELDTVSNIQKLMENAKLEIFDVEGLRPHYGMTLRHWLKRLEAQHDTVARLVGERTYRIWHLYMIASALQFEQGTTGIYQILAVGREDGLPGLPLTRDDLYEDSHRNVND